MRRSQTVQQLWVCWHCVQHCNLILNKYRKVQKSDIRERTAAYSLYDMSISQGVCTLIYHHHITLKFDCLGSLFVEIRQKSCFFVAGMKLCLSEKHASNEYCCRQSITHYLLNCAWINNTYTRTRLNSPFE